MATFKVRWHAASNTAYVLLNADANPAGTTAAGATFDHGDDPDDNLGDDGTVGTENHAIYHHVQERLYGIGVENMQSVTIAYLPSAIAVYPSAVTLDISNGQTSQITIDKTPSDAWSDAYTFVSADPTKATVSAAGLITPVAAGASVVTVTHTASGKTDTVAVTVQA